jgi:hypothetical protein
MDGLSIAFICDFTLFRHFFIQFDGSVGERVDPILAFKYHPETDVLTGGTFVPGPEL